MTAAAAEYVAYWIDPQGTVHDVGTGIQPTHARWMRTREYLSVDEAEDRGWHRAVIEYGVLYTYGRVPMTDTQNATVATLSVTHETLRINRWVRPARS